MHNKTIADISRDLAAGEYSSVEITENLLTRIKNTDAHYKSRLWPRPKPPMPAAPPVTPTPGPVCPWRTKIFSAPMVY